MKQYVVSKELVICCFSNEEIRHFLSKRILTKNSAIWQQDVFIYLLIICTGVKYSPKITSIPTVANRQQCIQSQHDLQQRLPGQTLNFFQLQSPGLTSAESAGLARPRHNVSCAAKTAQLLTGQVNNEARERLSFIRKPSKQRHHGFTDRKSWIVLDCNQDLPTFTKRRLVQLPKSLQFMERLH